MKKSVTASALVAAALALSACGDRPSVAKLSDAAQGYQAVKPTLDRYCVSCHSGPHASSGLHLEAYPFVAARPLSSRQIVDLMVARLTSTLSPMPPRLVVLRPDDAEIAAVKNWQSAGPF